MKVSGEETGMQEKPQPLSLQFWLLLWEAFAACCSLVAGNLLPLFGVEFTVGFDSRRNPTHTFFLDVFQRMLVCSTR